MQKLSELVNSALSDAATKLASASSVPQPAAAAPAAPSASPDITKIASREIRHSVFEDAKEATKFAESLDHLAALMPKIAGAMVGTAGPETLTSPDKGKTQDSNTKATTLTAAEASHGGAAGKANGQVANDGSVGGVPNRFSKKAAEETLLAKIAQSEALQAVGRAKEAADLANKARAEFEHAKRAFDEAASTPKGNPKTLETFVSGTTGAPGGVAPDNAGMASFTQRDGKKREIGPLSEHVREPAFSARSDRGIQDNFENTRGAKIASILDAAVSRKNATA